MDRGGHLLSDGLTIGGQGVAIVGAGLGVSVASRAQLGVCVEQVGQGGGACLVAVAVEAEVFVAPKR